MRDDLCADYRLVDMSEIEMTPIHIEDLSYRCKRFSIQTQRYRGNPKYRFWEVQDEE